MKKFNKYNRYISLKGLDQNIIERFENLNGKQINECCGCCCEPKECCPSLSTSVFIKYYNEYDLINVLKNTPKVQDLFDINRQFINKSFLFNGASPADSIIPLYFKEPGMSDQLIKGLEPSQKGTNYNTKLYNFINTLIKKYKMTYPVILTKSDGTVQLYFIKGSGTNGKECSIKNSLIEIASLLEELENMEEVTWSQVLDVSIDNLDDVYTFVITCTVDINKFN